MGTAMSIARFAPQQSSARNRLPLGWAVYESGAAQGYMYFPTSAIVSLLHLLENGASAEIAVVGNDGVVGIAIFMGGETTLGRAVVQSAGAGYRLAAGVLKQEFDRGGALQPRPHHRPRPHAARSARVRVLRGRAARNRAAVSAVSRGTMELFSRRLRSYA
jgi:CRP-like cAMP-binding protein